MGSTHTLGGAQCSRQRSVRVSQVRVGESGRLPSQPTLSSSSSNVCCCWGAAGEGTPMAALASLSTMPWNMSLRATKSVSQFTSSTAASRGSACVCV